MSAHSWQKNINKGRLWCLDQETRTKLYPSRGEQEQDEEFQRDNFKDVAMGSREVIWNIIR
jgi:hypothetical protein